MLSRVKVLFNEAVQKRANCGKIFRHCGDGNDRSHLEWEVAIDSN